MSWFIAVWATEQDSGINFLYFTYLNKHLRNSNSRNLIHVFLSAQWQPTHPLVPTPLPPREWTWPTASPTWDWKPKNTASIRCPPSTKPEKEGEEETERIYEKISEELIWVFFGLLHWQNIVDMTCHPLPQQWNCIVVPFIWLLASSQMEVCFKETKSDFLLIWRL